MKGTDFETLIIANLFFSLQLLKMWTLQRSTSLPHLEVTASAWQGVFSKMFSSCWKLDPFVMDSHCACLCLQVQSGVFSLLLERVESCGSWLGVVMLLWTWSSSAVISAWEVDENIKGNFLPSCLGTLSAYHEWVWACAQCCWIVQLGFCSGFLNKSSM